MGAARSNEDPNSRYEFGPKLAVTGLLSGSLDGRPVEILGTGPALELRFTTIASAWKMRSVDAATQLSALRVFRQTGLGLTATIAGVRVEMLPKPNFALRFLAPKLHSLLSGDKH